MHYQWTSTRHLMFHLMCLTWWNEKFSYNSSSAGYFMAFHCCFWLISWALSGRNDAIKSVCRLHKPPQKCYKVIKSVLFIDLSSQIKHSLHWSFTFWLETSPEDRKDKGCQEITNRWTNTDRNTQTTDNLQLWTATRGCWINISHI